MLAVPVRRADEKCRGGADALCSRIQGRIESGLVISVSMSSADAAHTLRQLQRAGLSREGADPDIAGLDMTRGLLWPCPWIRVDKGGAGLIAVPVWETRPGEIDEEEEMTFSQHHRHRLAASATPSEDVEDHWIEVALGAHPGVFGRLEAADTAARQTLTEAERRKVLPFSAAGGSHPKHAEKRKVLAALGRGELSVAQTDLKLAMLILQYYGEPGAMGFGEDDG